MAVETKVAPNKATDAQAAFMAKVRLMGGVAILAYSVDDVDAVLKKEGYIK
jgi:hypothetical protein